MNQKVKIFSVGLVLTMGAVLLFGAGCTNKTDVPVGGGLTGLLAGNLTDEDKCVEFLAHGLLVPSYMQNMAALQVLQGKMDNLKKQYGWSDDDISNNCQILYKEKFNEKNLWIAWENGCWRCRRSLNKFISDK